MEYIFILQIDGKSAGERETVMKQYQAVKKRVSLSHPQLYGGNKIKHEKVQNFIGHYKKKDNSVDEDSSEETDETFDKNEVSCI